MTIGRLRVSDLGIARNQGSGQMPLCSPGTIDVLWTWKALIYDKSTNS